jgi:hypothetical protein
MSELPIIPVREAFPSLAAWVDAWVRYRAALAVATAPTPEARQQRLNEPPSAYLFGTLGYDALLYPDGSVWVREYEMFDADLGPSKWYKATGLHRTYPIVAASRRFPELRRLLPKRTSGARDCDACHSSGFRNDVFPCRPCGGLGWHPSESSPPGDPLIDDA